MLHAHQGLLLFCFLNSADLTLRFAKSAIGGFKGCEFHIIFSFGGRTTGGTSGGMNLRLTSLVDNGMNLFCFL